MKQIVPLFLSFVAFALVASGVSGRSTTEVDAIGDESNALEDPVPDWMDLRVFIHRPRVVKPNHLGICAVTSNDSIDLFDPAPWHLAARMSWSLNRSTVPSSVASSVDGVLNTAFETWYGGVFQQGPDTRAKRAKLDGVNAILWKKLERSTVGATFVWFIRSTGEVVEVDTVFNQRHPWGNFDNSPDCQGSAEAYDLENIATHEFGHWIGLDDLFDDAAKDLTMYGFSAGGEVKKRTLGRGDIRGKNQRASSSIGAISHAR